MTLVKIRAAGFCWAQQPLVWQSCRPKKFSAASMKNMTRCFHLATYKIKVNLDHWIESNIAIMALRGSKPGHHVETGGTFVSTNVTCRFYLRLQWGWQFSSPARQTHSEFQSLYSYSAALFCILSASIYYSSPISHKFQLRPIEWSLGKLEMILLF